MPEETSSRTTQPGTPQGAPQGTPQGQGREKCVARGACGRGGCCGGTSVWALGSSIAVVLSWARNGSILWCILHGILSWIYVIWFAVTRK